MKATAAAANVVAKLYAGGRREDGAWTMDLRALQEFVGGYIDYARSRVAHRALVVNDDGIGLRLPPNAQATALAHPRLLMSPAGILGNALLVKSR